MFNVVFFELGMCLEISIKVQGKDFIGVWFRDIYKYLEED